MGWTHLGMEGLCGLRAVSLTIGARTGLSNRKPGKLWNRPACGAGEIETSMASVSSSDSMSII
jgi:hypothetical protein